MTRAVSETIGFVLVFAMVTSTIGIVYATGITGLMDAREAEQLNNVERAFDVLADNLADLSRSGAPSRSTEIKLAGGALTVGEPIEITITATNTTNRSRNASFTTVTRPIVYRGDSGSTVVYATGAVFRSSRSGSAMLDPPGWIVESSRTVIPLLDLEGGGSIAGTGTVLVIADRSFAGLDGAFDATGPGTVDVTVTVRSPRAGAWGRFFERRGFANVTVTDEKASADFETEFVSVAVTKIQLEITG